MMVATALGAFRNRWWLYVNTETGTATIERERTPNGPRRTMEFDTLADAREYFDTYTTPVVAVEA